jgi:hypothetical protein
MLEEIAFNALLVLELPVMIDSLRDESYARISDPVNSSKEGA